MGGNNFKAQGIGQSAWSIAQRAKRRARGAEGFEFGIWNAEFGIKGKKTKDTHERQRARGKRHRVWRDE